MVRGQAHKVRRFHRRVGLVEQVNQAAQLLRNPTADAQPIDQLAPNLVFALRCSTNVAMFEGTGCHRTLSRGV